MVFAVRPIRKEEVLSIDFLSWETANRSTFMQEKLGTSCECPFCCFQWKHYQRSPKSLHLLTAQQGLLHTPAHDKIALYLLWEAIDRRGGEETGK